MNDDEEDEMKIHVSTQIHIKTSGPNLAVEEKWKLLELLLGVSVSALLIEIILYINGYARILAMESLLDILLVIFVGAIAFNHYNRNKPSRTLRIRWGLSYFLIFCILFIPSYLVLYALFLHGYTAVFGMAGSIIYIAVLFVSVFFISTSWHWNRRFLQVYAPNPVRVRFKNGEIDEVRREESLQDDTESAIKGYVAGKIDDTEFIRLMGDSERGRRLLAMAKGIKAEIRKRFRW